MTATKEIMDLMEKIEQRISDAIKTIKSTTIETIQLLTAVRLKNLVDLYIETNELYIKAVEYETKNRRNKLLKECVAVLDGVTE